MSAQFIVLGSGTTVPDVARGPAGFLLRYGAGAWLVDGGTGTLQRCMRAGVDPRTLDGGIYSHRHPDHCADLVPLLFSMRVGPPPRARDYPIYAGEGFSAFFEGLRAVYGRWIAPGSGEVRIEELPLQREARTTLADGLVLTTRPANHTAGALHLRFDMQTPGGLRSVVFSGDTGPSDALVALATGADLLVCECANSEAEPVEGHLSPSEVAAIAAAARPRAVWLTHLYPAVDPEVALATVAQTGIAVRRAADLDVWEPR